MEVFKIYSKFLIFLIHTLFYPIVILFYFDLIAVLPTALSIADDVRSAVYNQRITSLTLLDFSKAFDYVYHPLLHLTIFKDGYMVSPMIVLPGWSLLLVLNRQKCQHSNSNKSYWKPLLERRLNKILYLALIVFYKSTM